MKKLTTLATIAVASLTIAACGSSGVSTGQVRSDLKQLMDDHSITYTGVPYCTHKSGNDFVCEVDGTSDGKEYPDVTDDGKSIFEQGA
jgi:hypothetical protein